MADETGKSGGSTGDEGVGSAIKDAASSFGIDPAGSPVHSCGKRSRPVPPETKHWIEIQMVDEDGKPVPGVRYRIKGPDGSIYQGSLDGQGLAHVGGLDPGSCDVTFPRLDQEAWTPA